MKEDIYCKVFDDIKPTNVLTIGNLADTFNAKQLLLACVLFLMENSIVLTREELVGSPGLVVALLAEERKRSAALLAELRREREE